LAQHYKTRRLNHFQKRFPKEFMQSQANRSIKISQYFSASPQQVWQAWTNPTIVKSWFGSDPNGTVQEVSLDVCVGGIFEVTFSNSDETQYTCTGTYLEITQGQKLVFSWSWKDRPDTVELVTVLFEAQQTGTLMIFEHANIDSATTHNYEIGWNSTFQKLERALKALR
jgi:uncharacterized protein YndB with AHSA1/START domain